MQTKQSTLQVNSLVRIKYLELMSDTIAQYRITKVSEFSGVPHYGLVTTDPTNTKMPYTMWLPCELLDALIPNEQDLKNGISDGTVLAAEISS